MEISNTQGNTRKRDGFQHQWGFILACIGSAVGMGNIWRFPILVTKYGGMTFLLPYFLFVSLVGSTGIIGEFAMGRAAQAGPVGAFGQCTKVGRGSQKVGEAMGWIPLFGSMGLAIGYSVVLSWIFKYTFMAFSGRLFAMGTDMEIIGNTFGYTSVHNAPWVVITLLTTVVIMGLGWLVGLSGRIR